MKKILIGVSGSIACYKAMDLIRQLKKSHTDIQIIVVLTKGAEKFLKPDLFLYLGAENCYTYNDDFNTEKINNSNPVLHINLARWCDGFILYPASANTLAKLAHGQADDLLSSIYLSLKSDCQKILFPAMNTQMYLNSITQKNLKNLKFEENTFIYPPESGVLLCGEDGSGKLPLPEEISEFLLSLSKKSNGQKILITTGATESPIDSIRYLTNPSSGRTGYLLTREALAKGYQVTTVATRNSKNQFQALLRNPQFKLIEVKTTEEMQEAVLKEFPTCQLYVSAAAPCDISFLNIDLNTKMKKSKIQEYLSITKSPDILKSVLEIKKSCQKIIGFAAESSDDPQVIINKLNDKRVDLLIYNKVNAGFSGELEGFQVESGQYRFCTKNNTYPEKVLLNKRDLAIKVLDWHQNEITRNDHLQKQI